MAGADRGSDDSGRVTGLAAGSPVVDAYTAAEARFNRRRQAVGLFLGPILFVVVLLVPMPALSAPAHRLAAVFAFVVVYWVTEAAPMAATAVAGPVLAVLLQVAPARQVLAPFADPIIFLFIGSFMLAEAMFVHGLDRRIAFTALSLRWVGRSPFRVVVAFGLVSTVLSMWISNTATAAMMLPIALSVVSHLRGTHANAGRDVGRFALAMMLMTAYGASIGGMATPVGTPPNLIGIALFERATGTHISFFSWMVLGVPVTASMFALMAGYFWLTCLKGTTLTMGRAGFVVEELRRLGPPTRGQRNVLAAFALTVALWLTPGVLAVAGLGDSRAAAVFGASVPEAAAALIGALLLFVLPIDWPSRRFTLTWEEAVRIDWGIVLLFGGGLALGGLTFTTGLAEAAGRGLFAWMPVQSSLAFTAIFTALGSSISEVASNTASATMIIPIAIGVSQAAGIDPVAPVLGVTLAASMAFMMPISTPPNAIVYSSGYVPITAMIRHGIVLDIVGFFVIVVLVMALGGLLA